jgi:hypothetical protein
MLLQCRSRTCHALYSTSCLLPCAGKQNAQALSTCNANLKRTDLMCELVGSLVFGWVYSRAGMLSSVALTSLVAGLALPLQFLSIYKVRLHSGVSPDCLPTAW